MALPPEYPAGVSPERVALMLPRHAMLSSIRAAVVVAALGPALPVQAQAPQVCADAGDLITGIVMRYASGGVDTFRRDVRDPAVVGLEAEFGGARIGLARKAQGYIDLSVLGPNGESVVYDYGILPAEMPKPVSGTEWEVVATITTPQGAATERQTYHFGEEGSLTIRDCTWRILPVTMRFADHQEAFYWFPDIGISAPQGEDIHDITPLALAP